MGLCACTWGGSLLVMLPVNPGCLLKEAYPGFFFFISFRFLSYIYNLLWAVKNNTGPNQQSARLLLDEESFWEKMQSCL